MNGTIVTLMEGRQQYQGCSAVVGAMAVVVAAAQQWRPNNQLKMGDYGTFGTSPNDDGRGCDNDNDDDDDDGIGGRHTTIHLDVCVCCYDDSSTDDTLSILSTLMHEYGGGGEGRKMRRRRRRRR